MSFESFFLELRNSYRKNLPLLSAYWKRRFPEFVFMPDIETITDEVPVFFWHFIEPIQFEEQLQYLAENDYRTLTADEFYESLVGRRPIGERAVLLTIDDGWASLWTYGYPLLKRYGMHAISFINPGVTREGREYFPNLLDLWHRRVSEGEIIQREASREPLCTWAEITEMASSGVVEFQSHTMYHSLIFTGPNIVDFFSPSFDAYANNYNVPIFECDGRESIERNAEWGMPIYENGPRMAGKRRYLDSERLRSRCIDFVRENGAKEFFGRLAWRRQLKGLAAECRRLMGGSGRYESVQEQREGIYRDLKDAKRLIEERLPGNRVHHLCYPYFEGSDLAIEISMEVGYRCNYWGFSAGRRANRKGDDPYRVVRLPDDLIFRLPGRDRRGMLDIGSQRFMRNSRRLFQRLMKSEHNE